MSVVSFRFQTLLGAMHTLALAILGGCAMEGRVTVRAPAVVRLVVPSGSGWTSLAPTASSVGR